MAHLDTARFGIPGTIGSAVRLTGFAVFVAGFAVTTAGLFLVQPPALVSMLFVVMLAVAAARISAQLAHDRAPRSSALPLLGAASLAMVIWLAMLVGQAVATSAVVASAASLLAFVLMLPFELAISLVLTIFAARLADRHFDVSLAVLIAGKYAGFLGETE
jgi:hypothetical protein